jgi:hypothetical protein
MTTEFTEFTVDEKDFDSDIWHDVGTICNVLYPGCWLFYDGKTDDGVHKYRVNRVIDIHELKKNMKNRRNEFKQKRLEIMNTVNCQVVKINGEYFIKDGDLKIPLFK